MQADADQFAARVVRVDAASRGYDVHVGEAIRSATYLSAHVRAAVPAARRAVLITDTGLVAESDSAPVIQSLELAGIKVAHTQSLRPSEAMKTISTVEQLVGAMTAAKLDRGDVAVVLGGGVLGDLVGFAAATYRRGIAWITMPTTLLAMVDASVGGKTGANVLIDGTLKKNMVGAFWQPSLVAADVNLLRTLDPRHLRSGLAECIKHGLLAAGFDDAPLGAWTSANLTKILAKDAPTLIELVARNVAVKARVVGRDEREEAPDADGGRALLNLGHTFGHAIETLAHLTPDGDAGHAPLQHGEAVALGLVAASATSEALGFAHKGLTDRVRADLAAAGLPARVANLPTDDELLARMADDKKVAQGRLRLVLPRGDGTCLVTSSPERAAVVAGWNAIRQH